MSTHESTRVLCLCCGSYYDVGGDCPRFHTRTHSVSRAADVARYLRENGCYHPRPLDVREALAALDAYGRGA